MKEEVSQWFYLVLLFSFIVILLLTILSFYYVGEPEDTPSYLIFFVQYHTFFMILIAVFGVIFGSITQFMTSKKIESNKKYLDTLKDKFMVSLDKDKKKIIKYLIDNQGVSTQYELTKLPNLNKLKVSRMLFDMEKQNLIQKEKIGKINKVFLNKELLVIFQNS